MSLIAKDTFLVKYRQLNDKKLFQPQTNIYWNEQRLEKYIIDNDLKNENKMKTIEARRYSDDEQTVDIHFSSSNDNFGQIFYIKLNGRFYWAYQISKEWVAGVARVRLQLELISSLVNLINKGYLGGVWYLERGHLITREFNTIHSDNCSNIANNVINYEKMVKISSKVYYFWYSNEFLTRKIKIANKSTAFGTFAILTDIGNILTQDNTFLNFQPLKIKNDIFSIDTGGLPEKDTIEFLNNRMTTDFDGKKSNFNDDIWWFENDNYESIISENAGNNILTNFPNTYWQNNKEIFKKINDPNTQKWFLIPNILDFSDDIISSTTFDIKRWYPNILENNHYSLKHKKYTLFLTQSISVEIEPIRLIASKGILKIERIINYDNILFNFYYNNEIELFSSIRVDTSQGLTTTAWAEYIKNKSISYESGYKSEQNQRLAQIFSQIPLQLLISKTFAIGSLVTSLVSFGFSTYSSYMQRYYNEQELLSQPVNIKNISNFELIAKLISDDYSIYKIWKLEKCKSQNDSCDGGGYLYNFIFKQINNKKIDDNLKYILLKIEEPILQDKKNIILDQKLYGNVINLITEIDNPLKIINDDFNYIKGTFNFSNTGGYKEFSYSELQYLRDKFLQGICVLNKADEWK